MNRAAFFRGRWARRDERPQTRATLEAERLVRAWRLGEGDFGEAVADLLFRVRLAQDAAPLAATIGELRTLHAAAATAAERLIRERGAA